MRQKNDHAANSGDNPVGDEIAQISRGHEAGNQGAKPAEKPVDRIHRHAREAENQVKHHHHDRRGDSRPKKRVQRVTVDLLGGIALAGIDHLAGVFTQLANRAVAIRDELVLPIAALKPVIRLVRLVEMRPVSVVAHLCQDGVQFLRKRHVMMAGLQFRAG